MSQLGVHWHCLALWLAVAALSTPQGRAQELRYGIIFDAGSSGSRIHVYTWREPEDASSFDLVDDDLVKIKPGLSAFVQEPTAAGASLAPLLEHAKQKIPRGRWASTPVFLYATAGLRLVGEDAASAIIHSVQETLSAAPFRFERDWASIMPPKEEALFGWVAVNYLLGHLSAGRSDAVTGTGIIDLGGGSVQFVHAVPQEHAILPEHKVDFTHAGRSHVLYARSHLGFGLDQARMRAAKRLLDATSAPVGSPVDHPCLPAGTQVSLSVGSGSQHPFVGTGSYEGCVGVLTAAFDCDTPPCAFDKAAQPPLPSAVFGFSYLYDRTSAIGLLGGPPEAYGKESMSVADIRRAAVGVCSTSAEELEKRFATCEDAKHWANFCGDAVYMAELLERGFGLDADMNLTMGNKIKDVEVVWTLGAQIVKSALARPASGGHPEL